MCRPGLPLWIAAGLCAPLLGACGGGEPQVPEPPAGAGVPAEPPSRARPAEDLLRVDLSDQAVAALSTEELWKLGVLHLGWPQELPAGATKDEVHQQLLQGKYRDVGDFGYGDRVGSDR
jgi:hypothetical protein